MSYEKDREIARQLALAVSQQGGRAYYVGGYVRDCLRRAENKDLDIEVHGLRPAQLEEILDSLGERITIGESFGIYSLKGCEIDIAMPRREENRGRGHRDFDVSVDPMIGTQKAAERRDFTVNAMMQDVLTGEIIDHFGGKEDLQSGIIRYVNPKSFAEDPLRVLRAAQFAARFGYTVSKETEELCSGIDLSALSRERVIGEMEKALLKAERPSVFFEILRRMDQLDFWFPELAALIGVPQNPRYHAEGDVWVHTMAVLDEAAAFRGSVQNPLAFMLSALVHDFGKALCTTETDGVIHAIDHEKLGQEPIKMFLHRLTDERALISYALNMTLLHMKPNILAAAGASVKSTNRMFDDSVEPQALIMLADADRRGSRGEEESCDHSPFLQQRLEEYRKIMARPYVMGRDLIEAGLQPGESFTQLLAYAHKLRLAGIEKQSALKQTLGYARSILKEKKE